MKKKNKKESYFIFNYVCSEPDKCIAFSIKDEKISAEWNDDQNKHRSYQSIPVPQGFWQELEESASALGVFEWKAYRLYSRFALNLSTEVFNAEGVFPDGTSFEANNLHGMPANFDEAASCFKKLFSSVVSSEKI